MASSSSATFWQAPNASRARRRVSSVSSSARTASKRTMAATVKSFSVFGSGANRSVMSVKAVSLQQPMDLVCQGIELLVGVGHLCPQFGELGVAFRHVLGFDAVVE